MAQGSGFKTLHHTTLHTLPTRAEPLTFRAKKDLAPTKKTIIKECTLIIVFMECQLAKYPTAKSLFDSSDRSYSVTWPNPESLEKTGARPWGTARLVLTDQALVPSLIWGLQVVQGLHVVPVFLYRYSMEISLQKARSPGLRRGADQTRH